MQNRVKEIRLSKGIKQYELAEKAGVARTIISQLENGSKTIITSETMKKIAHGLECEPDDIFLL